MIILQALYFMLPAYFANMAPVFASKIFGNKIAYPLDCNLKYNGRPFLGANKTWRGLIAGVIIGIVTIYLQYYLYNISFFHSISILDYYQINLILYGFIFGFGVILGDAIKSFFKRQANLKPGDKWFPWDQLDFLGALILINFVYQPSLAIIFLIVIISPLLPIAANWIGYKLGIKRVAW